MWEAGVLSQSDPEPLLHSAFDTADLGIHASYAGGALAPVCRGRRECGYLVNAKARSIRYSKDNLKCPALQATEIVNSPVHKWLIDTGCGHDLALRAELHALAALFRKANIPMRFQTANGCTDVTVCIKLFVGELGETIEPYIMASSPSVLSIGLRCQDLGYTFNWVGGKSPCFIP